MLFRSPVGKGRAFLHDANRFLDYVVGGWDIGGITNLRSGFPFTIFASSTTDFSGLNQFADRPIVNGPLSINYSNPDRVFTTGNFSLPAAGNIGNAGRNAYYGPGYVDFDFSLQKNFSVTESKKFQFRAEFFNLFDHANFDLPVGNLASGSVGTIIGDTNANPRLMQLGLRFDF